MHRTKPELINLPCGNCNDAESQPKPASLCFTSLCVLEIVGFSVSKASVDQLSATQLGFWDSYEYLSHRFLCRSSRSYLQIHTGKYIDTFLWYFWWYTCIARTRYLPIPIPFVTPQCNEMHPIGNSIGSCTFVSGSFSSRRMHRLHRSCSKNERWTE